MKEPEFNPKKRSVLAAIVFSLLLGVVLLEVVDYFGNLQFIEIKILTYAVIVIILYLTMQPEFEDYFMSFLSNNTKWKDL